LRGWPVLPRLFGWLLERLRALHAFRETSHFDITRPLAALQEIAAEWGRRLVARGLLGRVEDVYDLTHDEVRRWLLDRAPDPAEARQMLTQRRATYALVNERWQAERGCEPRSGPAAKGVAVSPGLATGPARIVRDEGDFDRLAPGEVLVCPHTNPAWTPLFASAAAVVTETGGVASHAAIVAREYGIPAVMAVPGATARFEDGESIRVDGFRGVVSRLDRSHDEA
jgi:pyruvate,water dikinase